MHPTHVPLVVEAQPAGGHRPHALICHSSVRELGPLMSAPQTLFQAAMNRLVARVGSALADRAAELAVLAQDAPARVQQEFSLFWQEVELEAERIERGEASAPASSSPAHPAAADAGLDPQTQIDRLRAQVAELSRRLESPTP